MCVSCGCDQVNDEHGDKRNITMQELEQAARAAGITVQEVAKNIQRSVGETPGSPGRELPRI